MKKLEKKLAKWKNICLYYFTERYLVIFRSHRLMVRTSPFHGGNTGSNPVGITIFKNHSEESLQSVCFKLFFSKILEKKIPTSKNKYSKTPAITWLKTSGGVKTALKTKQKTNTNFLFFSNVFNLITPALISKIKNIGVSKINPKTIIVFAMKAM